MRSALKLSAVGLLLSCLGVAATAQTPPSFTLRQAMSAPFNSDLTAASTGDAFAWVSNAEGKRNIWVAVPSQDGSGYVSRQITSYSTDDGQQISDLAWSADAQSIFYVRGGSSDNPERLAPNPAHLPEGAEQDIWVIAVNGGRPRKVAKGHAPSVSPTGNMVAWFADGQIWYEKPADIGSKPPQSVHVFGDCKSFIWSPDGRSLAFVSDRGSHSFIGFFSPSTGGVSFVDPGVDHDSFPTWSPDSNSIAFVRAPYDKDENFDQSRRSGRPWSIRVADVSTGEGHEIWKAAPGNGSVFRAIDSPHQLFWTADGHVIFPWEGDGWLHLYAVPAQGGSARLLTPGEFEVESAAFSPNREWVVLSSNQGDIERRHLWRVSATGSAPVAITNGEGIEVYPVVASDNQRIASLRSDARIPLRPAVVTASGQMRDFAPQAVPADFPSVQMIVPQPVTYSATDGMTIHADLFLPPGAAHCEKHPAVVFVHGGSQRQMVLGWHYMGYYSNDYALNQYLASRGYVVLSINYRGGIGYGLDFREAPEIGATGGAEFRDVEGAGLYLRSRCDVEPQHIGIWGGSWGGYLTAMALSRASGLFSAGVDLSGVHDWNIDHPENFQISDTAADVNARWRLAWQSSPLATVDSWRSPVLLIQGDNDDEVPFLQTVRLAAALRKRHVCVETLVFPDELHDFLLHRNWVAALSATANFLDEKLRPGKASPAK
ncbi:MAG TPA: prolyl oligopeptidase family serine peptidase [Acidobacteriaceae bacterium]|jgi:dipeptidyl aminopeptidase/acylaminoacyl peptidase|nr:prolyl oligopeptidase family serine peptidase [Acidobacteriaceae bacterium]